MSPDTILAAHVEQLPDLQEYGKSIPCSSAASRMYMSSAQGSGMRCQGLNTPHRLQEKTLIQVEMPEACRGANYLFEETLCIELTQRYEVRAS